MKELAELAQIATRAQVRKLLKGSDDRKRRTLVSQLYDLVSKGDLEEEEMVVRLYGKGKTVKYAPFRNLKLRLYEILMAAILNDGASTGNYSSYNEASINGYRHLNLVRVLFAKRAWNSARAVALTTFRRAEKFQIIPLNYSLADLLAILHLGVGYNEKAYRKYQELTLYYAEAQRVLNHVAWRYREVRNMIYAHKKLPKEIGTMAKKYAIECEDMVREYPKVSLIQTAHYLTKITGYMLLGEYAQAFQTADVAEQVFTQCYGVSNQSISIMTLTRVECSVKLNNFEEGKIQVQRAKKLIDPETINGIKLSEYAITLGLQSGHYDYAYQELRLVDQKNLRQKLTAQHVEYWLILEAYVNLLVMTGKITVARDDSRFSRFKLSKVINEVSSYTKNKQGMNIQIIILQFVYYTVQKKYGKIIDKSEAIERYGSRYLKNNDQLRNNCLFKMLLATERCNFHRAATLRKTAKTYQKMISSEAISLSKANNAEIIPYEVLWEIVIENLSSTAA